MKKQQTTTNVQPTTTNNQPAAATPVPATAPKPQAEVVSKQQKSVEALLLGLKESGVKVDVDSMVKPDGKYLLVRPWGPAPTIKIGPSGSYDIVEVKSFAKADLATMLNAKVLYDKAQARYAKKAVASVPAPAKPSEAKETPTTKKARQGAEVERQLQHA
jgi:hypothetical protein